MKETCKDEELHQARIKSALSSMPSDEKIEEMGARFKTLAEPSRLKILLALSVGELCVDHITEAVGGNQSAVSHQLKTLKDNKIVKCRMVLHHVGRATAGVPIGVMDPGFLDHMLPQVINPHVHQLAGIQGAAA